MIWLSDFMMEAVAADKTIVAADGNTYLCKFDREAANFADGAPALEDQKIWQIKKIAKEASESNTIYSVLYPENSKLYRFKLSNYSNYEYGYTRK